MRRRVLLTLTCALAILGLTQLIVPFVASLSPSARADAALDRILVSDMKEGSSRIVPLAKAAISSAGWQPGLFVLRRADGTYRAWAVPLRNGHVGLPDIHWWRPMVECEQFGPTLRGGLIDASAPIKCHQGVISKGWADQWQWSVDGKSAGGVDDLEPAHGVFEGGYFVVSKRAAR